MDGTVVSWSLGGGYLFIIIVWAVIMTWDVTKDHNALLKAKVPWVVEAEEWERKQDN